MSKPLEIWLDLLNSLFKEQRPSNDGLCVFLICKEPYFQQGSFFRFKLRYVSKLVINVFKQPHTSRAGKKI